MSRSPRTVLIVGIGSADFASLQHALEHDLAGAYTCVPAPTAAAARAHCRASLPDAIVLDDSLADGMALLGELSVANGEHACAIVLLVEAGDQASAAHAQALGAHDYLIKGPELARYLGRAIAGAIAQAELRRQNAALLRELAATTRQLRQTAIASHPADPFSQEMLDTLDAHVAIVDREGQILAVNTAWARYGRDNGRAAGATPASADIGVDYLSICRAGADAGVAEARSAYDGIREVLSGQRSRFRLEYRCDGPQTPAWFVMSVTPLASHGGAIIAHANLTAHRQAEAALHRSERTLALFIEHAPTAIALFDCNMTYLAASRRYLADYHLGAQNIIGRSHYAIFPEISEHWRAIHWRCLTGAAETGEELFHCSDGTQEWVRWEIHPWYETSGDVGGLILFSEVITTRKRAEQALRQSEARFAKAFRANPAALVIFRLADGCFVEANETYQLLLGYRREELIGRTARDLNIFPDLHARSEIIRTLSEQGAIRDYEVVVRTKAGEHRTILLSSEVIDLDGEACALITGIDITERQRAQVALEAERLRLERLHAAAAALAPTRTRDEVLRAVIYASSTTLGAGSSVAAVVDRDSDMLTLTHMHDDPAVALPVVERVPIDTPTPLADAIHQRELLWFESRAAFIARYPQLAQHFSSDDDFALICVPFLLGDRALGSLALRFVPPRQAAAVDVAFLEALAYQCAQALDRGLLYDTIRATTRAKDEALALLDTLFASAPVGLAFLDRELRFVRVNAALAKINGRPAADHIGRRMSDILPQLAPMIEPLYQTVLETGRPIVNREINAPATAAPGELRHWLDSYYPVAALGAPPIGVGVIVNDVTEITRTSAALHASEQKLAALVDLLPVGISILNTQSKIIYANPALERIMNMSRAQLFAGEYQARRYLQSDGTPRATSAFASARAAAEQRVVQNIETGILGDDGDVMWLNVSAVPVGLADWSVVVVTADITERKRAEDGLRASRQQLMDLSVRLVNAQEDERRALAYELHDEIGQQLTSLNMILEIGARASAAQLRVKLREAQRLLADLTGQVRQLSLDLRPPMLDELGLLPTLLWHIQRYTRQTNVIVDFKSRGLDAALPPHVAIAAYRIVQEGLTNVARHAQTSAAVVRVWISAGQLKIAIEDAGRGFDASAAPQLGRSVGLAGMRERTLLLGGQLSLDSAPGEGTRIRVTLPADAAQSAESFI